MASSRARPPRKKPQGQSITAAEIDVLEEELRRIGKALRAGWRPMTDRNRRLKFPRDGAPVVRDILGAARQYGVAVGHVDLDGVAESHALSRRVRALSMEIRSLLFCAEDIAMQTESEVWGATTLLYSLLARMAKSDSALDTLIKDSRAFFKEQRRGKGKKKKAAASASSKRGNGG